MICQTVKAHSPDEIFVRDSHFLSIIQLVIGVTRRILPHLCTRTFLKRLGTLSQKLHRVFVPRHQPQRRAAPTVSANTGSLRTGLVLPHFTRMWKSVLQGAGINIGDVIVNSDSNHHPVDCIHPAWVVWAGAHNS